MRQRLIAEEPMNHAAVLPKSPFAESPKRIVRLKRVVVALKSPFAAAHQRVLAVGPMNRAVAARKRLIAVQRMRNAVAAPMNHAVAALKMSALKNHAVAGRKSPFAGRQKRLVHPKLSGSAPRKPVEQLPTMLVP